MSQSILRFRGVNPMNYKSQAIDFSNKMEYRTPPTQNDWGHPCITLFLSWKNLPAIAHILVRDFTSSGDIVLDPLCGVGMILLKHVCKEERYWKRSE